MSEQFKIIYKILKLLRDSMNVEEFDADTISPKVLRITDSMWNKIITMLVDNEYVTGIQVIKRLSGENIIYFLKPEITLKGLEYLEENSLMKKASNIAKGFIDATEVLRGV